MDADGVTVYVWRFRKRGLLGIGTIGHASIGIRSEDVYVGDFYLSWWPGGNDSKKIGGAHTTSHNLQAFYGKKPEQKAHQAIETSRNEQGYLRVALEDQAGMKAANSSDKSAEGRTADAKYRFNLNRSALLDEIAMKDAFESLHEGQHTLSAKGHAQGGEYNLLHQNCSDAVVWLLERGGAGKLSPKPKMRFYWTPTDVAKWCDLLVVASNVQRPGSATRTRGFTNNNLDFTSAGARFSALA